MENPEQSGEATANESHDELSPVLKVWLEQVFIPALARRLKAKFDDLPGKPAGPQEPEQHSS